MAISLLRSLRGVTPLARHWHTAPTQATPGALVACVATAVLLGFIFVPREAASHDNALTNWANALLVRAEDYKMKPVATVIDDHFNHNLLFGAQSAETACSGTSWAYDYRHHIAAGRDRGNGPIQMILYAKEPPTTLPDRDLSSVTSALGLHLGMATSDVARLYRVSPHAIHELPDRRRVLYLKDGVKCGSWICGHDKIVVFQKGRAVSISLHDHGP